MENRFNKKPLQFLLYSLSILPMLALLSCSSTPKYIKQLHVQFGLDIKKESVSVISENEKWGPNGDGFYLAKMTFKNESNIQELFKPQKFKPLPINEDLPVSEIHRELSDLQNGYYMLDVDKSDPRDFRILTFDLIKNEMIFYYQLY